MERNEIAEQGTHFDERVAAFTLLLRQGEVFSHTTALQLLGCPIRVSPSEPLHVTIPAPRNPRRAAGVCGHKVNAPFVPWARPDGVLVAPPTLALAQAAATLTLVELVVAIDSLVLPRRSRDGILDLAVLKEDVRGQSGRGILGLRRAVSFARVGAESRMETLLRLVLHAFDLAQHFELQVDLSDEAGWIGRFDFVCLRCKVVVEYDGEQHRTDRAQYLKDLRRLERVRESGYKVIRVHAGELLRNPAQVARTVAGALGVPFETAPRFPELLLPR